MAKTYRVNGSTRVINWVFRTMTKLGVGASYRYILTVRGRKTGRLHSTPVDVMDLEGARWLVAGYGPASWVGNASAAGAVTLSRGGRSERFGCEAVGAPEAVPALRKYMRVVRVTRSYFDASPDSPDEAIAAELARHAVFRLTPLT